MLVYPIRPMPRTAVLETVLGPRGTARIFDTSEPGWIDAVRTFAPGAIAGRLEQIDSLAGMVRVTHAVIVLRSTSDARLSDAERERLWRAFQVPAFEQVIAADGTLLAAECEAHAGLHIESPRFANGDHAIDASPCACGRPGGRVVTEAGPGPRAVAAGKSI